jgi:hypothetical protein
VAVSWTGGRDAGRTLAASPPLSAGISKSGASLFVTDVLTAFANAMSGRSHEP